MLRPLHGLLLLSVALGCSGRVRDSQAPGPTGMASDPATGTAGRGSDSAVPRAGSGGTGTETTPPDLGMRAGDPGRVTLHRLNRAEYANTVRDLLGTTLRPSDDFPNDDRGYGYDNIAQDFSTSKSGLAHPLSHPIWSLATYGIGPRRAVRIRAGSLCGD